MTATTRPQVETVRAVAGEAIGRKLHPGMVDVTDRLTGARAMELSCVVRRPKAGGAIKAFVGSLDRSALAHRRSA